MLITHLNFADLLLICTHEFKFLTQALPTSITAYTVNDVPGKDPLERPPRGVYRVWGLFPSRLLSGKTPQTPVTPSGVISGGPSLGHHWRFIVYTLWKYIHLSLLLSTTIQTHWWSSPVLYPNYSNLMHGLLYIWTELLSIFLSWFSHTRREFGTQITPQGGFFGPWFFII